jgi:hypothetical protein
MARKLSIALAVVLAIFAGLPSLGHAQVRGGGFHGGGWGWVPVGVGLAVGVLAGFGSRGGLGLALERLELVNSIAESAMFLKRSTPTRPSRENSPIDRCGTGLGGSDAPARGSNDQPGWVAIAYL